MQHLKELFPEINNLTESELMVFPMVFVMIILGENEIGEKKVHKVLKTSIKDPLKAFNLVSDRINRNYLPLLIESLNLFNRLVQRQSKSSK